MGNNPKMRSAVDCRETGRGDVREKITVGNAFEENQAVIESRQYG